MTERREQTFMDKVGELINGKSPFEVMAVFSWYMSEIITRAKLNPLAVMADFTFMVRTAADVQNAAREGVPPGTLMQ